MAITISFCLLFATVLALVVVQVLHAIYLPRPGFVADRVAVRMSQVGDGSAETERLGSKR
jgi:hypothetical protein